MNDNVFRIVAEAIADHLAVDSRAIAPWQELERELGLGMLDLTFICLRVEGELGLDLRFDRLHRVRTVGDIVLLARHTRSETAGPYSEDVSLPARMEKRTGTRPR